MYNEIKPAAKGKIKRYPSLYEFSLQQEAFEQENTTMVPFMVHSKSNLTNKKSSPIVEAASAKIPGEV